MINIGSLSGRFEMRVYDACTHRLTKMRAFDNLITDQGLAGYCGAIINNVNYAFAGIARVVVGNGTAAVMPSDTALSAQLASTDMNGGTTWQTGISAAPEYVSWAKNTARFPAGTFNNTTLTEVGITGQFSRNFVFSRALILDEQGQPSSITVLPNEYLDVTYTIYYHPNKEDTNFQLTMNNATYDCVARCAFINRGAYQQGSGSVPLSRGLFGIYAVYNSQTLGELEGEPVYPSGGKISTQYTGSEVQYSTETPYTHKCSSGLALSAGNFDGGIGAMVLGPSGNQSGIKSFTQISFTPKLPKDANTEMSFTLAKTVSRYTAPTP